MRAVLEEWIKQRESWKPFWVRGINMVGYSINGLHPVLFSSQADGDDDGIRAAPPPPPAEPAVPPRHRGHLHLFKKPLHRALSGLAATHGPVLLLHFGSRAVLHVTDPAVAEECLTDHDVTFANRPRLPSSCHLSNGYTTLGSSSYGPNWRNLRRIATVEVFSAHRLLRSADVRGGEVPHMARWLYLAAPAAGPSEPARADVKARAFELVLNVVARMVAGKQYYGGEGDAEAETEEAARFREMVREYFAMHGASNLQDFVLLLGLVDIGGAKRRAVKLSRERNTWAQRLIDEHRATATAAAATEARTMVGDLLKMQASEPEAYSDKVITALCLTGTDTSSSTIEWGMALLLNHPAAMAKARAEIDRFVGTGRVVEEADLPNLPYLQCIIRENLRLYPVGPLLAPHESSADCSVSVAGGGRYAVPAGTMLLVNVHAMHRDARFWGPDPESFSPERFEGGRSEGKWMLPFGMGRRRCPGEGLAVKVVGLALATLVQCFEWRRVGDEEVDMTEGSGLTMPKAVPLEALYWPRPEMVPALSGIFFIYNFFY
uniref:OSJNBa0017P10.2 protein n=1 Tax=Oryza sativa subsp. japonica TaxID=39947 RepID=Q7XQ53_ORYSJ|nr:OSJNBb0046P18.7 [Oryza sativa Japonica Group]CAE04925.2 OSJNBa0017P10.2 [Oryza sativa Japonica Group]